MASCRFVLSCLIALSVFLELLLVLQTNLHLLSVNIKVTIFSQDYHFSSGGSPLGGNGSGWCGEDVDGGQTRGADTSMIADQVDCNNEQLSTLWFESLRTERAKPLCACIPPCLRK